MRLSLVAADWGRYYLYLTELFRENTLDLPEDIEDWSTKRLRQEIRSIEAEYGRLREII